MNRGGFCAFPFMVPGEGPVEGMTIREYFAARAPVEPQTWFEPKMEWSRPCLPDWRMQGWTDRQIAEWRSDYPPDDQVVSDFIHHLEDVQHLIEKWDRQREKQRLLQWPWAWADAVLAAGESV